MKTNNTTESGIVLPNSEINKNVPATVIEVGKDIEDLKAGDLVIVDDFQYHDPINEDEFIVSECKILATVEG